MVHALSNILSNVGDHFEDFFFRSGSEGFEESSSSCWIEPGNGDGDGPIPLMDRVWADIELYTGYILE